MTLENAGTIPLGEILVVEDNAVNLITLSQIIKTAGYRVRNAADGEKALAAIAEKHPDLVLLDILIPGVNGIDVCKRLKQNPLTFEIPIIFLSGKDEIEIKVSAFEAGGEDYITKPFHPVEVLSRIKTHLDMARKISDLKQARRALMDNDRRFRILFENSTDALMTLEPPDWLFVSGNNATLNMFRAKNEKEFISFPPWELSPKSLPDGRDAMESAREMIETAMLKGSHSFEWTHKRINGEEFPATVLLTRMALDGKNSLLATVRDITEHKQYEEALRASEEKFRNLFNNAEVGMFRTKVDGSMLLDLNEKYLSILGRTREETIGKPSTMLWADPKEREEMVKTLTAKGRVDEMECRLKKKDGSIIDCLTSLRLYPDQGVLEGSIIDITERKRMEKELQNAQKLESLGVLAGGIAHDFNNLMGGIFGYIDLALEECDDPKISRYLAKTMNTIERARGLTQQLLTFSTGGSPIRKLDDLFPFIQETVQFALSGSNVSCGFKVAKDLRSCNFDKNQIGQVIDNIVINAQQAMPSGGAMEISAENISFTEKKHPALSGGEYVRISIKDHGVGIPKEALPRIFDPFYTTKTKGHGLGLATCYSIVNRHGGCIDVESEPGKGSTFHVYLPAEKDPAPTAKASEIVKHKGSGTFLVMDDQEVMRETIGDMLVSLGYTVASMENGLNAIDFVKTETKARRKISAMMFDLTAPAAWAARKPYLKYGNSVRKRPFSWQAAMPKTPSWPTPRPTALPQASVNRSGKRTS